MMTIYRVRLWTMFKGCVFLIAIEVFLLTARLFTYSGRTASKQDQTQFPDGGYRKQKDQIQEGNPKQKIPNRFSTVSKKDQT